MEGNSWNPWNPWAARSLDEFRFYCCPECGIKNQKKFFFVNHILSEHPLSMNHFSDAIKAEINTNNSALESFGLPDTVKQEFITQMNDNELFENENFNDFEKNKWKESVEETIENVEHIDELKSETPKQLVCCTLCDYTCKSTNLLGKHMKNHKKCPECGEMFSGSNASKYYKRHMKKHLPKEPKQKILHKCEDCHVTFEFKSYLVRHYKRSLCQRRRLNSIKTVIKQEQSDDTFDYELMNTDLTNDDYDYDSIENQEEVNGETIDTPKKHSRKQNLVPKIEPPEKTAMEYTDEAENYPNIDDHSLSLESNVAIEHSANQNVDDIQGEIAGENDELHHNTESMSEQLIPAEMIKTELTESDNVTELLKTEDPLSFEGQNEFKTIKCDLCSYVLINGTQAHLNRHILTVHDAEKTFKCKFCDLACITKTMLSEHVRAAHKILKKYACQICGKKFNVPSKVKRHIQAVHEGVKYDCDFCDRSFSQKNHLKDHIKIKHEGLVPVYKCDICDKSYAHKQRLKVHKKVVHEGIEDISKDVIKQFKCDLCEKAYTSEIFLKNHILMVHEGKKNFTCEICGYACFQKSDMQSHKKHVHQMERNEICHLCGKAFKDKYSLTKHVKIVHEGIKPHECDSCEKKFASKCDLENHVNSVHKGISDHKCHLCIKEFYSKQHLKNHIKLVHENIKDFQCDKCDKAFKSSEYLKVHIAAVHEGKRNFSCEYCGKTYAHKEGMRCHIRSVHEGIRYQCDFCSKSFTQKPHLKSHMSEAHGQSISM